MHWLLILFIFVFLLAPTITAFRFRQPFVSTVTFPSPSTSFSVCVSVISTSRKNILSSLFCCEHARTNTFVVNKSLPLTEMELANDNLVKMCTLEATDEQCNDLAWKCLGYVYDPETNSYDSSHVFPKWAAQYPQPLDLIGVKRIYSDPSIDRPVRDANMGLMRTVPRDFKGGIKSELSKVGFKGWKLNELTPNKTRRAQVCNWIIFYRERLYGKTIEQLRAAREEEKEREALERKDSEQEKTLDRRDTLPSEKMYQKLRVDE